MSKRGRTAGVLALFLLLPTPGRAGLYSVEEPPPVVKLPRGGVKDLAPQRFRQDFLPRLRQLTVAQQPESPLRQQYLERKEALENKQHHGRLSEADQINLSYYLVRLGQPVEVLEALEVLRRLEAQGSRNFMVYANLATVHVVIANPASPEDLQRNLGYAKFYLRKMDRYWPKEWPGWTAEQLAWYRKAEKYFQDLVNRRLAEARDRAKQPAARDERPFETVDELFPVKFTGPGGKYEPGRLPGGGKLTGREVAVVQQLLTWLPQDSRLYWLFGEVLNASGDVPLAAGVLEDCVRQRNLSNVPLLREHRSILLDSLQKPPPASWLPDFWQWLLVGTGVGLVIVFLTYYQIREIRRRRLRRQQAPGR